MDSTYALMEKDNEVNKAIIKHIMEITHSLADMMLEE